MDIVLYSRDRCCLCDDAKQLLESLQVAFRVVDIDQDSELRQRYNDCVPVIQIDGKDRFRGRIDRLLLVRQLRSKE